VRTRALKIVAVCLAALVVVGVLALLTGVLSVAHSTPGQALSVQDGAPGGLSAAAARPYDRVLDDLQLRCSESQAQLVRITIDTAKELQHWGRYRLWRVLNVADGSIPQRSQKEPCAPTFLEVVRQHWQTTRVPPFPSA